jgi:hypothetical protein
MRGNNKAQRYLRTFLLMCAVLSLASPSGNLLQVSARRVSREQPLSRREVTAYGIPRDAIATRGQSFSVKLCKSQRPQLDKAIAGNPPTIVLLAVRIPPVLAFPLSHSSDIASLPTGRAPPRLA